MQRIEVDLLDEETRLVIELDGGQHFASEDAYRRDRRKDALLQEHGYFVLRFLVQDIQAMELGEPATKQLKGNRKDSVTE